MQRKKLTIFIILIFLMIFLFFLVFNYNSRKNGNNIIKSADGIKNYILNISSYTLQADVIVNSNKNQNKYIIKQEYEKKDNLFRQEVLEPSNLKGIITIYDGNNLSIENNNFSLSKIYENYPFINSNNLWINSFIEDLKIEDCIIHEEENVFNLQVENGQYKKTLLINKETYKPEKLVVEDSSKNISVYIEYKEIEIN